MMDNLPELRDIHLPDEVSVFPLAYGWWIVIFCILAAPFIVRFLIYVKKNSKKVYAYMLLKKLTKTNSISSVVSVSELLKRICIYKYPEAVNLFGKKWIDFLNNHCSEKLLSSPAMLLSDAPYIAENTANFSEKDYADLYAYCKKWIGENL